MSTAEARGDILAVAVSPDPGQGQLCRYLKWDSDFFGFRIASATTRTLDSRSLSLLMSQCQQQGIECLYFLAPLNHDQTIRLLEQSGFHLVDVRMTFARDLRTAVRRGGMRPARPKSRLHVPGDLPVLREIARMSYHDTRFCYDSHFPKQRVSALYETWIENSCNGFADAVLVVDRRRRPVGYITCHLRENGEGQIGLIGVDSACQGLGIGGVLVTGALQWFAEHGRAAVTVATQARNEKAMRLYERCGFVVRDAQLWYHRWFGR
jgi:dTDP-4-amino-4,6-dideoxy-D-galactose acyltransferase